MSKNENPKKLYPKNLKFDTTCEGNFFSVFFLNFDIFPTLCSILFFNYHFNYIIYILFHPHNV